MTISLSQTTGMSISPFSSLLLYLFVWFFFYFPRWKSLPFSFQKLHEMMQYQKFTFRDLVERSSLFDAQLKLLTQTSPWNAMECLRMAEGLYKHSIASKTKTFGFLIYIHHNITLFSCFSFSEPLNYFN